MYYKITLTLTTNPDENDHLTFNDGVVFFDFRFKAVRGISWDSDIALDRIRIMETID